MLRMVFLLESRSDFTRSIFSRPIHESDGEPGANERQREIHMPAMQTQCRNNSRKPGERDQQGGLALRDLPVLHKCSRFSLSAVSSGDASQGAAGRGDASLVSSLLRKI